MTRTFLLVLLCAVVVTGQQPKAEPHPAGSTAQDEKVGAVPMTGIDRKVSEVISSGRVALIGESSSERLAPTALIAPGTPPILAFRYFDGQARHRFGELDLVMDDAGH